MRLYITGMSGTGKSSSINELKRRDFFAIDTDYDDWCDFSGVCGDNELILNRGKMNSFLCVASTAPIFISGCRSNQKEFYHHFNHRVLLSAPLDVIIHRVKNRTSNPYGRLQVEIDEIASNYINVQPLLRASCDYEIDTVENNLNAVVDRLIEISKENTKE